MARDGKTTAADLAARPTLEEIVADFATIARREMARGDGRGHRYYVGLERRRVEDGPRYGLSLRRGPTPAEFDRAERRDGAADPLAHDHQYDRGLVDRGRAAELARMAGEALGLPVRLPYGID